MKRMTLTAFGVVTLLVFGVAPTWAQQAKAFSLGKKADVEVTKATRIGSITLEPGFYRLQYEEQAGQHYLVVKARQQEVRAGMRYAVGGGKEVARVPCMLQPLPDGARNTAVHSRLDSDGVSRIDTIQVRGEHAAHSIVQADHP